MGNSRIIHGKKLDFDEVKHQYTWGGKPVTSVTTFLNCVAKPVLVPWAVKITSEHWLKAVNSGRADFEVIHEESKKVHRQKAAHAASIGTNVHKYAEAFVKNLPLPHLETDEAKRGVEAFHKWFDSHRIKILSVERRLYSKEYDYAGTADFVAEIDGFISIGDYKTSSGIYPEMRLQTAAYQHALQEEKKMELGPRWIVRFDKITGLFEAKPFHDFDSDFSGFKGALALHRSLKAMNGSKKNETKS